jgi:hypothetical protein
MIDDSVAVTLVPESDGGPYMANLGLGRYYTRSGSTSLPMEHFQVVDVFNRRRRPDPRICATRLETADVVAIEIENVGRVTAKAPYVELRALGDWDLVEHANLTPIAIARRRGKPYGFGGNTAVVHPQTRLFVCQFGWQGHPPPDVFKLEYALAAEDAPLTTGLLTLRNQPGATQRSMSTWD